MKKRKLFLFITGFALGGICIILISFFTTEKREINPYYLCREFYELNKNNSFESLYNVRIFDLREGILEKDSFNYRFNYFPEYINIYDSCLKKWIVLSTYKPNSSINQKQIIYNKCVPETIESLMRRYNVNDEKDVFDMYVNYIDSIFEEYYRIKTPCIIYYNNIPTFGDKNFIEFVLYKNDKKRIKYKYYYLKDTTFSNENLKKHFEKLPKFDNNWYYDIN